MNQCKSITKSGEQCKRIPLPGRSSCWQHDKRWITGTYIGSILTLISILLLWIGFAADIITIGTFVSPYSSASTPTVVGPTSATSLLSGQNAISNTQSNVIQGEIVGDVQQQIIIVNPTPSSTSIPTPTPPLFAPAGKEESLVLVADFMIEAEGKDRNRVTQTLVEDLRTLLSNHTDIRVERLGRTIPTETGSETAVEIGRSPEFNASIVIWGDYVLDPAPELYMHFDIVQSIEVHPNTSLFEQYGPMQILQPTMFEFKHALSNYLGQMVAFTVGIILYSRHDYNDALPYFTAAIVDTGQKLDTDLNRLIRFYRGTSHLLLGELPKAKSDFGFILSQSSSLTSSSYDEIDAAALGNMGLVLYLLNDLDQATLHVRQAYDLHRQASDLIGQAHDLNNLGLIARQNDDYKIAEGYHKQALDLHEEIGNRLGQANALGNLGLVAYKQHNYEIAEDHHLQALDLHEEIGNRLGQANALGNLGLVAYKQHNYNIAEDYHLQALDLHEEIGNRLGQANALGNLGLVAFEQNNYLRAWEYHHQALNIHQSIGDIQGQAYDLTNLVLVACMQEDYATAEKHFIESTRIFEQLGINIDVIGCSEQFPQN